jgi:hypothetical protein
VTPTIEVYNRGKRVAAHARRYGGPPACCTELAGGAVGPSYVRAACAKTGLRLLRLLPGSVQHAGRRSWRQRALSIPLAYPAQLQLTTGWLPAGSQIDGALLTLTLPMILFIFPCVFIIVGVSAGI